MSNDARWLAMIVVSGRGGVGKTLLTSLLATTLLQAGRAPVLVQADTQRRLDALFPDLTTTIDINLLDELANDPLAVAKAFSPIPKGMRIAAHNHGDAIVDVAATWHTPVIHYCAQVSLAKKAIDLGGRLLFLLPTTADVDAVMLTIETVKMIETLVPLAKIILVRNAHPAHVDFLVQDVVKKFGKTDVQRILKSYNIITLPAISPTVWGYFERANLSPLDVIAADPKDLVSVMRTDVDTVEIAQAMVESWMNTFIQQTKTVFAFRHG
jgi:hypothetical protein